MTKPFVGLGNPGPDYTDTRHNAGFWWIDALADQLRVTLTQDKAWHGMAARTTFQGKTIWLLKPQTFMNLSGRSVAALARFFKIAPQEILVAHDELDLPPGSVKLKFGGSASGNGVRSVIARLGTPDFWRLRIGIGHPRELAANEQEVVDYVLHAPRAEERRAIDESIARADDAWPLMAAGDMQAAMHRLHTKPAKAAPGPRG
ncbi:MAG: aminoacyl-tRNA hydrolase [Burkholderiales bacterium]|nr:aminoacyl-tRNA hydrolase [Burkholderiales bacterium]